jgi:hypothetical protein
MKEVRILGIYVRDSFMDSEKIQAILTKYGCTIRTRLGLHNMDDELSGDSRLILLELSGDIQECMHLENELLAMDELDVQKMVFRK